jgi:hypothetical protein
MAQAHHTVLTSFSLVQSENSKFFSLKFTTSFIINPPLQRFPVLNYIMPVKKKVYRINENREVVFTGLDGDFVIVDLNRRFIKLRGGIILTLTSNNQVFAIMNELEQKYTLLESALHEELNTELVKPVEQRDDDKIKNLNYELQELQQYLEM